MSRTTNGAKIEDSRYALQATRYIYEGNSDPAVMKLLRTRDGFEVSLPCVAAFRNSFYPKRLKEMVEFSIEFQKKQSGRIKTFIDESMDQATAIKQQIAELEKQQHILDAEIKFTTKFDFVFKHAIDKYLASYDINNPQEFLKSNSSPEESLLAAAIESMGKETEMALDSYVKSRGPGGLYKLRSYLAEKLLAHRKTLVEIHKDVFKSYRNFSILQELTNIFDEYNAIIIEEFFPNRSALDKEKYLKVKQRILALYDKLQIRYQGVEAPSSTTPNPTPVEAEKGAEYAQNTPMQEVRRDVKLIGKPGPVKGVKKKTRTVITERERITTIDHDDDIPEDIDVTNALNQISEDQALRNTNKIIEEGADEPLSLSELSTDLDLVSKRPAPLVDSSEAMPYNSDNESFIATDNQDTDADADDDYNDENPDEIDVLLKNTPNDLIAEEKPKMSFFQENDELLKNRTTL